MLDTRLRKLEEGHVDALIPARAGLNRLGLDGIGAPVPVEEMLPVVGQGAVCVECRATDARITRPNASVGP